jgi:hypothetical protein
MNLNYSNEELNAIEYYASLLFSPIDIAIVLEKDSRLFLSDFKNNECNIKNRYYKGSLVTQAKLRKKLIDLAHDGSNTAITDTLKILKDLEYNLALL